jgi:hypothetical protein
MVLYNNSVNVKEENGMNNKKTAPCGIAVWVWIISTVAFTVLLNAINKTGQSMGSIIFASVLIGGLFGVIAFCIQMTIATCKARKMAKQPFKNPYVDTDLYDTGSTFPVVNYPNLFLKEGETIIYAVPAKTFLDKEQVVGYTGTSGGVSVRVAKGVSVRTGGGKGRPVRQEVRKYNEGDYIVTNMRIVFVSQNDGFEYDLKKISAIKPLYQDAFVIMCGNKQKNIVVDVSQANYAFGLTRFAIQGIRK